MDNTKIYLNFTDRAGLHKMSFHGILLEVWWTFSSVILIRTKEEENMTTPWDVEAPSSG